MAEHWSDIAIDWIVLRLMGWPLDVAEGTHVLIRTVAALFMLPWMAICLPVFVVVVFPLMAVSVIHDLGSDHDI